MARDDYPVPVHQELARMYKAYDALVAVNAAEHQRMVDKIDTLQESVVQERHLGQLMFFAQQRWQSMAEDLWEELQEWHDEIDCPTFNGDGACTCHRILAEHWAQLTNAADYADDGG